ncbi:helix-turn-helix domain-containing protein [Pseudomonas oryzihabitans]|uniref:helix-turn-helix domain-containing protein n=1 Tax=Pseudomonas oryzihabitans TaxID=47885 RepID=UPI0028B0E3E5|nr:helix-turn-helix domain-containing protein [Pseudomonas oryzihabitans]
MSEPQAIEPLAVGPDVAAVMASHSRSAIYKAIAAGELHSFKSGKRRLILVTDLKAWLSRIAREGSR